MSFEKMHLGDAAQDIITSPRFEPYTRVTLKADGASYSAGTDTGRELTVECPFGNQQMADNILTQVNGFSYQPYEAMNALVDPAAEIGDGINIKGIYSGLYNYNVDFNPLMPWNTSAPKDNELEHEYGYVGESNKFATVAGLKRGTTAVNGAGLMVGSVNNDSIAPQTITAASIATNGILNRCIASGQIYPSTCNQEIQNLFAEVIAVQKLFAGSASVNYIRANIFGLHQNNALGAIVNYLVYVGSDGIVRAQKA